MGATIFSDAKMQYYATNKKETYKMLLNIYGTIKLNLQLFDQENYELYQELHKQCDDTYDDHKLYFSEWLKWWLIENERYDLLEKYMCIKECDKLGHMVIADLFAGEGEWLKTFTLYDKNFYTVGNELDEQRYNNMATDNKINESYCGSFEELQLPKYYVSLMLFNPPYGESNGVRNVKRYFNMILERQYITNKGCMILVLNKDDFIDISHELIKYFDVQLKISYKFHKEEYDKYHQICVFAKLRDKPIDDTNKYQAEYYEKEINKFIKWLDEVQEFDVYNLNYSSIDLPLVDTNKIKENFKYVKEHKQVYSNPNDKAWKWFMEIGKLKSYDSKKLIVPKPQKTGELGLTISAGYINGNIDDHIVVGGIENVTSTDTIKDEKGDTKIVVVKSTRPYLNVLVQDKETGKVVIKKLKKDE